MVKEEQSAVDLAQAQSLLDQLYDQCATRPAGTLFFQRDFINMQVADDMGQLLSLIQSLTDKHLMKLMTFDGEACWQIRSRAEADTCVTLHTLSLRTVSACFCRCYTNIMMLF